MAKKILITGASGFIATQIAEFLYSKYSYEIYGISRNGVQRKNFAQIFSCKLGEKLSQNILDIQYDLIIHAANSTSENAVSENINGTKTWFTQLTVCTKKQLLLSSISALSDNDSDYAKSKKNLECFFHTNTMPIVRLGLVIGNGGLFKNICDTIKKFWLLPLINNGKYKVYITSLRTIDDFIDKFIHDKIAFQKSYNLQNTEPVIFKSLLTIIKNECKASTIFVPIPFFIVYYPIVVLEALKIWPFKIKSSNLKGLIKNSALDADSDVNKLNLKNIPALIEIHNLLSQS